MWLEGPKFLTQAVDDPEDDFFPLINPEQDKEVRATVVACKTSVRNSLLLGEEKCQRFSSWKNLVATIACLQHVASSCHNEGTDTCRGWHICDESKRPDSHQSALYFICKQSQESFPSEVSHLSTDQPLERSSSVLALSPFLDEGEVIRVGGRLRKSPLPFAEKHPNLISGKHYVVTLFIRHYHESVQHQGRQLTEGAVRTAGFWITGGKRLISKI